MPSLPPARWAVQVAVRLAVRLAAPLAIAVLASRARAQAPATGASILATARIVPVVAVREAERPRVLASARADGSGPGWVEFSAAVEVTTRSAFRVVIVGADSREDLRADSPAARDPSRLVRVLVRGARGELEPASSGSVILHAGRAGAPEPRRGEFVFRVEGAEAAMLGAGARPFALEIIAESDEGESVVRWTPVLVARR